MFKDSNKILGIIASVVFHVLLFLIFIFFGLKYQDPPPEPSIAIVFGFDKQGEGDFTLPPNNQSEETQSTEEQVAEQAVEENQVNTDNSKPEELLSSNEESPVVAKEKPKPSKQELEQMEKQKVERERIRKEKAEADRIQKENDEKKKNLDNMFSNFDNNSQSSSQGDDGKPGYKGDINGDKNSKSFKGSTGVGGNDNYQLGDRLPTVKPKPIYDSAEHGIVVVRILVDRQGKVVFAEAGAKGSTTSDLQLLKRAKEAALKTNWQSDPEAPEKQEGRIIYNFVIEN